ncbi:MAG TPA: sigma factor-like helix-turn-helix DNA-binding protein [Streptosporangiaceae bacterium]|jgi:DNA-binding NarL/FixJ family response regulator
MIDIALVTENQIMAEALAAWLPGLGGLSLAAICAHPAALPAAVPRGAVVIADLGDCGQVRLVAGVRGLAARGYRVLAIGSVRAPAAMAGAFAAGARGCLARERGLADLAAAVRRVAADALIPPDGADGIRSGQAVPGDTAAGIPALSAREREVLLAYVSGMTLETAARHVGVRPDTARTYLRRVKAKYQAAGRPAWTKTDLARRVWEEGWGGPDDAGPR